jgi:hypothetical protein
VTLQVYQVEEGKQVLLEIPGLEGQIETEFQVRRDENTFHIQRHGPDKAWSVLLVGISSIEEMENAEIREGSALIRFGENVAEATIRLK